MDNDVKNVAIQALRMFDHAMNDSKELYQKLEIISKEYSSSAIEVRQILVELYLALKNGE